MDDSANSSFIDSNVSSLITSNTICGSIFDALDDDPKSPPRRYNGSKNERGESDRSDNASRSEPNPTSALFARALVAEVTDNPRTMVPAAMAAREKRLLKAQERARQRKSGMAALSGVTPTVGGFDLSFGPARAALTGPDERHRSVVPPNQLSENRAQVLETSGSANEDLRTRGRHTVTIGLSLSRRHSTLGHPDTVTRQTAFDFNELQDRSYRYVSSTDSSGWRAGGGERGGAPHPDGAPEDDPAAGHAPTAAAHKVAAPDTVHIPVLDIDAESPEAVDGIIGALARGEVFIPHMSVLPEALSVNGVSPPDLVVRFGCERNDDSPPDEWPNWCLEFMHNQLYEYFRDVGARWTKRPFQITLAKKVRWRTVKHMNKFFAHSERVINAWREKGPQYLNPQLSYIEGGATPEEVARPHGIYLLRNGRPTNYFAPNFEPPYTTKMTRSLLMNVIGASWDKKRRDWTSEPIPRLVTPAMLIATVCGCGDGASTGFVASDEAKHQEILMQSAMKNRAVENYHRRNESFREKERQQQQQQHQEHSQSQHHQQQPQPHHQQDVFRARDHNNHNGAPVNNTMSNRSASSRPPEIDNANSASTTATSNAGKAQLYATSYSNVSGHGPNNSEAGSAADSDYQQPSLSTHSNSQPPKQQQQQQEQQAAPQPSFVPVKKSRSARSSSEHDGSDELRQPDSSVPSDGSSTFSRSRTDPGRPGSRSRRSVSVEDDYQQEDSFEEMSDGENASQDQHRPLNLPNAPSPPPSDGGQSMGMSIGESHTTIPMSNHSPVSVSQREREMRSRKLDQLEEKAARIKNQHYFQEEEEDAEGNFKERVSNKSSKSKKKEKRDKEKREKKEKRKKEKELNRKLAQQQQEEKERAQQQEQQEQEQQERLQKQRQESKHQTGPEIPNQGRSPSWGNARPPPAIHKTPSNHSLDYSIDDLSYATGNFTADGSVNTTGNQSLLSYVTRSTVHTQESNAVRGDHQQDDDDSLVHSLVSAEEVPSDEALFGIGWAKALDENSGSYYYFTLDRSKTVWDNPLLSDGNGSVPGTARTFSSESGM